MKKRDMVEVVRCGECRFHFADQNWCEILDQITDPNFFCRAGERKPKARKRRN